MLRYLLVVISIGVCASVKAQLVSEADINEKLVDAFIVLEQLSESYCCRGTGTYSIVQENGPKVKNLYIIAARSREFEFHSWGQQIVEGGTQSQPTIVMWHDALRDIKSKKNRFKISIGDGQRVRSKDQEFETVEQLAKDPKMTWTWPELDPFGLVFGSEDRLQRRESSLARVRQIMFEYTFVKGSVLSNRNLVGEWKCPSSEAVVTIEFDREHGDLPKSYKWVLNLENNKSLLLGHTTVSWVKYLIGDKSSFVPRTTKITTERSVDQTVDVELSWEWIPYKVWEKQRPDVVGLLDQDVENFRKPFVDLFDQEKTSKPGR